MVTKYFRFNMSDDNKDTHWGYATSNGEYSSENVSLDKIPYDEATGIIRSWLKNCGAITNTLEIDNAVASAFSKGSTSAVFRYDNGEKYRMTIETADNPVTEWEDFERLDENTIKESKEKSYEFEIWWNTGDCYWDNDPDEEYFTGTIEQLNDYINSEAKNNRAPYTWAEEPADLNEDDIDELRSTGRMQKTRGNEIWDIHSAAIHVPENTIKESNAPKITFKTIEDALYQWYIYQLDFNSNFSDDRTKEAYDDIFDIVKASSKPSFGLINEIIHKIEWYGYDSWQFKKNIYGLINENKNMKNNRFNESLHNNDDSINNLISKIEIYKDIVSNSWIPMPWEIAYSKVPEGLKLTIDTDEWFDKENPLGRFIDFILDIYNSDYDSSVRELTGIDVYSDVEFLGGEKSGYATYLIKNNESNNLKETEFSRETIMILKALNALGGKAKPSAIYEKAFGLPRFGREATLDFKQLRSEGLIDYNKNTAQYELTNKGINFLNSSNNLKESIQGTVDDFCKLKGIDTDQFVEFLQTNFDWARHCEAWTIVDFDCLERCFSKLDEATIAQAKRFASRKHGERGQVRKATGAPYIVHPEGVAKIVKDFGGDDEQIQAAWLHDTMEDTGTWEEDLREKFGDRVADLVSELTNDDFAIRSIGKEDYMSNKLVNLSDDALLIKLSDFLYNIKDYCPMKTLERMKKNLEALNFSGRKLDDKCDRLLIDCLKAIDEEM